VTVYTDNPAGRLHGLITTLRKNSSTQPTWQAWAGTLQVPSDDLAELMRQLAIVYALPGAIESELGQVEESEFDRDYAMRWQGEILGLLGPRLFTPDQSQQVIPSMVSNETLGSLESCSYLLHKHRPQRPVPDDEMERIAQMIRDLEEAVRADAGMAAELRAFLLFHCRQMSRALRDYTLRGPSALEDALDQAIGAAYRRTDLTSRAKENPGAWKRYKQLLVTVGAVLQIATAAVQLPGQVQQALEGPQPPAPPAVVKVVVESPHLPAPAPVPGERAK